MGFDLDYHLRDKPEWIIRSFKKIDAYCLIDLRANVKRTCLKTYIRYTIDGRMFCRVFITSKNLRIYLKLDYSKLERPPTFVRDYSGICRTKDTIELLFDDEKEYLHDGARLSAITFALIKESFKGISSGKVSTKPVEKIKEKPAIISKVLSLRLTVEGDCVNISIRVPRGQLNRILDKILY